MGNVLDLVRGNPDLLLIFAVWAVAVVFLYLGYSRGGDGWEIKFNQGPIREGAKLYGVQVELIMVTLTAGLVVFVNQLTPAAPLIESLNRYWIFALALLIAGFATVYKVSQGSRDAEKADADRVRNEQHHRMAMGHRAETEEENWEVGKLRDSYVADIWRGYIYYNVFSTAIFTFYVVAAMAVVGQLVADHAAFLKSRAALDESLLVLQTWKFANTSSVIASIEETNSLLWNSIHAITEQINTVLLLFFFVLVINFAITYTPIRAAYSDNGIWSTHCITVAVLLVVLAVGWYLYYTEYLVLIRGMLAKLSSIEVRGKILGGDWEITQRYYELLNDLRGRQGITGFVITMCSERGGVLLLFYAMKWFYDQREHVAPRSKSAKGDAMQHGAAGRTGVQALK